MLKKNLFIIALILSLVLSNCKKKHVESRANSPSPAKGSTEGMALIKAGEFTMGIDEMKLGEASDVTAPFISARTQGEDAKPAHKVYLDDYYLDKYEVTYDQFLKFIPEFSYPEGKPGIPVTNVSWFQAEKYCAWLGKRLPTEQEWEKAARGTDGRRYSWGNKFEVKKANLGDKLMPVGSFETDKSPYGVYDLVGSVSEWTADWYKPYPESAYKSKDFGEQFRVFRGGSFNDSGHYFLGIFAQVTFRYYAPPHEGGMDNGFRCALSK